MSEPINEKKSGELWDGVEKSLGTTLRAVSGDHCVDGTQKVYDPNFVLRKGRNLAKRQTGRRHFTVQLKEKILESRNVFPGLA